MNKFSIIICYALVSLITGATSRLHEDEGIAHTSESINKIGRRALATVTPTRKPRTRSPTRKQTAALYTFPPTRPYLLTPCVVTDKTVYECGEPITVDLDYTRRIPGESARISDRIGIYPCYIEEFKKAEVWQWGCGAPPDTPQTCDRARSKGTIVFNKLPAYNRGGQSWPLAPNYNKERKEVNRCFQVVVLRDDGEPYTRYCESNTFKVYENTKAGCKIRLSSPTD